MDASPETPLIDELKELSGSDKLHRAFKFLFAHEYTETEVFIRWLGERCHDLEVSVEKTKARLDEVFSLNQDDEIVVSDVYESLHRSLVRQRRRLEALTAVLTEVYACLTEKEEDMDLMDWYD